MCNATNPPPTTVTLQTLTHTATVHIHIEGDAVTLKLGGDHCGVTVAQLRLTETGEVTQWTWKVSEAETAAEVVVGQAKRKE